MRHTAANPPSAARRPRARGLPAALLLGAALLLTALLAGCNDGPLPGLAAPEEDVPQAQDTYPFTTGGYVVHWGGSTTITVYRPPCAVTGCQPGFEAAVDTGINAWAAQIARVGLTLNIVTTSQPNDVTVEWDDGTGVPAGVIGYATFDTSQPVSRRLVITTRCNVCGLSPHTPQTIEDVTTHEWGHMMGIWNHSFDPADLMYPYYSGQPGLTPRDRAVMDKAYGFAPDLNLATLPPNPFSLPSGAPYLRVRFLYGYEAVPHPVVEFDADPTLVPRHEGLP